MAILEINPTLLLARTSHIAVPSKAIMKNNPDIFDLIDYLEEGNRVQIINRASRVFTASEPHDFCFCGIQFHSVGYTPAFYQISFTL